MTSTLSRRGAVAMVVAVVALVLWGLLAGSDAPAPLPQDTPREATDEGLYEAINDRLAAGDGYYAAAVSEQVDGNYPTSPAMAVRTPTLAYTIDLLGQTGARVLLGVLLLLPVPLMLRRFEQMDLRPAERWVAIALLITSTVVYLAPIGLWAHEAWALGLMLLSLALRSDQRWGVAVLLGVAAPFYRELALVYPAVMLLLALRRNRREALAWGAGIVAFLGFYAWHVHQVALVQVADPPTSPGWLDLGGWPFVVDTMAYGSFVTRGPYALLAVLVPLALAGWWFVRHDPVALRMVLTALAFAACFLLIGRPENNYWGALYAAMLMPGLAFVPRGSAEVWRSLRGRTAEEPTATADR